MGCVMDDDYVGRMPRGFAVRRVRMPSSGVESWTVVGPDGRLVGLVDEFLGWLTGIERSPNTVEACARDLAAFWSFLGERGLEWDRVSVAELGEFAAWARRPAPNVLVLSEQAAKRSGSTVNRMLTAIVSFYEFQGRRGNTLAERLVVRTRSGRGGYKPFLDGIARARPRGRAVRLPERQRLPRTLSLEPCLRTGSWRSAQAGWRREPRPPGWGRCGCSWRSSGMTEGVSSSV